MARYTQEQYQKARYESSALEYALSHGYKLIPQGGGKYYKMADHDSMVFSTNGHWWWNSRGINGGAIEFAMYFEEKTLPEAVLAVCGELENDNYRNIQREFASKKAIPDQPKDFKLPEPSKNFKQMFAYLLRTRCLNYGVISDLVKNKQLYQSNFKTESGKEIANAVFVGYDADGNAKSAFQRGCSSFSSFKREISGSDKTAPFVIKGNENADTLYVFEGAIDAVSHASIYANVGFNYKNEFRLATGGNAPAKGIINCLAANPNITNIVLCFDNDSAGQKIEQKIKDALVSELDISKYNISSSPTPIGKDYNDYCCKWKEMIAQYKLIPTTELVDNTSPRCGRLHIIDIEDNSIGATVAYSDPTEFYSISKQMLDSGTAVVVETPRQVEPYRTAEIELQTQQEAVQAQVNALEPAVEDIEPTP